MVQDPSQDTTSEWLERAMLLAGIALFFSALLIAAPLPSMVGFLDDDSTADSADVEEAAVVDESTPAGTETTTDYDQSDDAGGASTESGEGGTETEAEDRGDDSDEDGSDDADEADQSDDSDDSDEDDDADEDDSDDQPGNGNGRDGNNGNGRGNG